MKRRPSSEALSSEERTEKWGRPGGVADTTPLEGGGTAGRCCRQRPTGTLLVALP